MQVENSYLDLTIASDRDTLIQQAFANLAITMPGWKPREGNLDVLLIEQFSEMASEAAQVAAMVPLSIFSYYGSLLGITQNTGVSMVIQTTWQLTSNTSVDVFFPAGTIAGIQYNGVYYQFTTNTDLTILTGSSSGSVKMTAIQSGTSYNSLSAGLYLQPLYYIANLSTIQISAITTSALDAESTTTYLDRLTNTLTTYTPRPIVATDYATMAQQVTGVGRAVAYDNTTPLVNQLPVGFASPIYDATGATGWSAVNGATVATNSTSGLGITVTPGTVYTYALASSYTAAANDTFLPFVTTVIPTGGSYTSSTTSLTITNSSTQFPNAAGVGYLQNTDGTLTKFTYSASTSTTITVVFTTSGTYSSNALIAFAGNTNFATTASSNVALYVSSSGTGTPNESVFVKSVTLNSTNTIIGWKCSPLQQAYPATITYSSTSGATTSDITVNANSANMVGFVANKLNGTNNSFEPVLVAKVTYKDNTIAYYYSNLVSSEIGTLAGNGISVYIPGISPNLYTGTIVDTSISRDTFARGINTVSLTMYYPGNTSSSSRYVRLASLCTTNKNVSFYCDGAWQTSNSLSSIFGNNNPANIVPDALFQSVYSEKIVTTSVGSISVTSATVPTSITVTSTAGWPSSGTGLIFDGSSVMYFVYTGLTATTLTGVKWSWTSGSVTFASGSTVTALASNSVPQQWNISSTTYGKVVPMPGYGVQFTPLATTLGGTTSISSNDFALPSGTYFLDATIDATAVNTTNTSYLPTVELRNAISGALVGIAITATTGTKTRNNASPSLITVGSNATVYLNINFPTNMPVNVLGQSVLVTNIQLIPMTGVLSGVTTNLIQTIDALGPATGGPTWTPGGYSAWNSVTGNASNNAPRSVMVSITDPDGMRPTSTLMQNVENYLNSYREINFDVNVLGPTYQIIDIIYSVNAAKGYDPSVVQAEILSNLEQYISPTSWAGGLASPSLWDGTQGVINYLDVVGRIDDADGVANVTSLQIGARPASGSTTYITSGSISFTSLACLPILGSVAGTIVATNSSVLEVN